MNDKAKLTLEQGFHIVERELKGSESANVVGRNHSAGEFSTLYFSSPKGSGLNIVVNVSHGGVDFVSETNWKVLAQGIGLFYTRMGLEWQTKRILYCPCCDGFAPLALHFYVNFWPNESVRMGLQEMSCGSYHLQGARPWGDGLIEKRPCRLKPFRAALAGWNYDDTFPHEYCPLDTLAQVPTIANTLMFWHGFLMNVKKLAMMDYWSR